MSDLEDEPIEKPRMQPIGLLRLVALIFLSASGGTYGSEDTVRGGGALLAVLGPILVATLWSLPIGLVTAELSTAIPHDGGYVIWVHRAYGPLWSFQSGYWNLISSLALASIYPNMITDYLNHLSHISPGTEAAIEVGAVAAILAFNLPGLYYVATVSVFCVCVALTPLILLVLLGFSSISFKAFALSSLPRQMSYGLFFRVCLWNQTGFDNISMVAGEVRSGAKLLPAMLISVFLVASVYVLPLMVMTGVLVHEGYDFSKWVDGYLAVAGQDTIEHSVGGNGQWMRYLLVIGSCTAQAGQLFALICTTSRALYVMGLLGTAPSIFTSLHSRFNTPWVSLVTLTAITAIFAATLEFNVLVDITIAFYAVGMILRVCAFLSLRMTQPDLPRPFKFGGDNMSFWTLVLLCIPCLLLSLASIIALEGAVIWVVVLIFALGFILYGVTVLLKARWPSLFVENPISEESVKEGRQGGDEAGESDSEDALLLPQGTKQIHRNG